MMLLLAFIAFVIALYLIGSVVYEVARETSGTKNRFIETIALILDVISDPITSEGMRIFFGLAFAGMGIVFLYL